MRTVRKTGDPVKEAVARPENAPSNQSASMDLYGFEDGPVEMRPDLLLQALLIGRSLSSAGKKASTDLLKKGQTRAKKVAGSLLRESAKKTGEQTAQNTLMEVLGYK
jgi:hypothetical protein